MSIKLILLNSGEKLISDVKEAHLENQMVSYILEQPCQITLNGKYEVNEENPRYSISFNRWPVLSSDTIIELNPKSVVTISEPIDQVKLLYQNQILEKENESN